MKIPTKPRYWSAVLAGIALFSSVHAAVTIDYVPVGNAGNANDPATGNLYGGVAYDYRISANETTIAQYAEFLNAVAATDPNGLYNTNMGSDANIAGITRSGSDGSYSYSVTGSGLRPITYVSWYDAARFANWLHNGQGSGDTETGAYTLTGNTGLPAKNVGATVWIPSESEWYKAAYYDPTKDGTGGYWDQATRSDTIAGNTVGAAGSANYYDGDYAVTQSPIYSSAQNYLSDGGAYGPGSQSAYGTNDQAGNVFEWNDAVIGSSRGLRGGSWSNNSFNLAASNRNGFAPSIGIYGVGFRVASVPAGVTAVPEASGSVLMILSAGALLMRRRRSPL